MAWLGACSGPSFTDCEDADCAGASSGGAATGGASQGGTAGEGGEPTGGSDTGGSSAYPYIDSDGYIGVNGIVGDGEAPNVYDDFGGGSL